MVDEVPDAGKQAVRVATHHRPEVFDVPLRDRPAERGAREQVHRDVDLGECRLRVEATGLRMPPSPSAGSPRIARVYA
jgi:hypothetical protein